MLQYVVTDLCDCAGLHTGQLDVSSTFDQRMSLPFPMRMPRSGMLTFSSFVHVTSDCSPGRLGFSSNYDPYVSLSFPCTCTAV